MLMIINMTWHVSSLLLCFHILKGNAVLRHISKIQENYKVLSSNSTVFNKSSELSLSSRPIIDGPVAP